MKNEKPKTTAVEKRKKEKPPISADTLLRIRNAAKKKRQIELKIEALKVELEKHVKELDLLDMNVIPDLMRMAGTNEIKFDDGAWSIELSPVVQAAIPKDPEIRQGAFAWFKENGFGGMIKSTLSVAYGAGEEAKASKMAAQLMKKGLDVSFDQGVHPQTLKSWVRERLKIGATIPSQVEYIDTSKAVIKVDKEKLRNLREQRQKQD